MSIDAINSVNFTGHAVTKNGNDYNKTNVGKYIGTAAGVAWVSCPLYVITKNDRSYRRFVVETWDKLVSFAAEKSDAFKELRDLPRKEYRAARFEGVSHGGKVGVILATIGLPLVGLGLGAVADGIVNHFRAKKADKSINA